MDTKQFLDSFRDVNQRFMELLNALSALRALADVPSSIKSEASLLEQALHTLIDNQDFQRTSAFLLSGDQLEYAAGVDWTAFLDHMDRPATTRVEQPHTLPLDDNIFAQAALTRTLQLCNDCARDNLIFPGTAHRIGGALVCVPIAAGEHTLGILTVHHTDSNYFNETHLRTLTLFSSFLGQILANARHSREMEETIRQRTLQLEQALAEAEDLRERYRHLAVVDDLTGLHNRRFFFSEAGAAIARALRHQEAYCLLMMELDQLDAIYDTYGHAFRDRVLHECAQLIQAQTRYGDILAHFANGEFALALPHSDLAGAREFAQRMNAALYSLSWLAGRENLRVTASLGLAALVHPQSCPPEEALDEVIAHAYRALQAAKQQGKNRVLAYTDLASR